MKTGASRASRRDAGSLRSVGARDVDAAVLSRPGHADPPGVAAYLAVLDEAAFHVGLEINLDLLPAIRAHHCELIVHPCIMTLSIGECIGTEQEAIF